MSKQDIPLIVRYQQEVRDLRTMCLMNWTLLCVSNFLVFCWIIYGNVTIWPIATLLITPFMGYWLLPKAVRDNKGSEIDGSLPPLPTDHV